MARSELNGDVGALAGPQGSRQRHVATTSRVAIVRSRGESVSGLVAHLRSAYDVVELTVGRTLVEQLLASSPDVVIVDHSPGEFDVMRVCRDLHANLGSRVVVVSGDCSSRSEQLEIALLDAGVDDFMGASSSAELVAARVRLVLRGRSPAERRQARLSVGDVVIDPDAYALYIGGAHTRCSRLQFQLLAKLATELNRVVDGETLLRTVWGAEPESVHPRRLRVAISLLRGVLGTGANRPRIETVPHVGYRLVLDGSDHGTAA